MAAKTYEAGYSKYYGDRLKNVSKSTSEEEIKQLYRDWASSYDEVRKTFWCKTRRDKSKSCQRAVLCTKNEWKIIEVGAGTGLLGLELHELGYNVLHALDISAEMLNEAKKKNFYKKFICASLSDQRIPEIDTGEYDALICVGTLFRGHARSSAFLEMIRMVRIAGLICFDIRDTELGDYQGMMLKMDDG
ncbi:unnamed protein product [Porites lobata]|uniref:Methyltransferase domain-containing protein n=1 Tax=Porites lobata TaxID=104759 RepID=A0ABN8RX03_9CNID|nr:unnamed protein product [Porites lobata]